MVLFLEALDAFTSVTTTVFIIILFLGERIDNFNLLVALEFRAVLTAFSAVPITAFRAQDFAVNVIVSIQPVIGSAFSLFPNDMVRLLVFDEKLHVIDDTIIIAANTGVALGNASDGKATVFGGLRQAVAFLGIERHAVANHSVLDRAEFARAFVLGVPNVGWAFRERTRLQKEGTQETALAIVQRGTNGDADGGRGERRNPRAPRARIETYAEVGRCRGRGGGGEQEEGGGLEEHGGGKTRWLFSGAAVYVSSGGAEDGCNASGEPIGFVSRDRAKGRRPTLRVFAERSERCCEKDRDLCRCK